MKYPKLKILWWKVKIWFRYYDQLMFYKSSWFPLNLPTEKDKKRWMKEYKDKYKMKNKVKDILSDSYQDELDLLVKK